MHSLKITLWNANGLSQHNAEVQAYINICKVDVLLITETHFTSRSHIKIPGYNIYYTNHPSGNAHAGTAVIIKSEIKHHEMPPYRKEHIQATSVVVEDWTGPITISAVYKPPRHNVTKEMYKDFFRTLGQRFIAGGDYNAKHIHWGSRLTNPQGTQLLNAINDLHLDYHSSREPTYWPKHVNRRPDLLDFFITKSVIREKFIISSCLDLTSDHTAVCGLLSSTIIEKEKQPQLHNERTDWDHFRLILQNELKLNIPLRTEEQVDSAVNYFTTAVQSAAWRCTPQLKFKKHYQYYSQDIQELITLKRKLRKKWQQTRHPNEKRRLNHVTRSLRETLLERRNAFFKENLINLSADASTDYSLWKCTKNLKQPQLHIPPIRTTTGEWARTDTEKVEAFAKHLSNVFQPFVDTVIQEEEEISEQLEAPFQLSPPIKAFSPGEIVTMIKRKLSAKKSPGFDLITGRLLKELPRKAILLLTAIFNAILRVGYYPLHWKIAHIILIPKPGKPINELTSYRPISLLPIVSKLFEKLFLTRLQPVLDENHAIPDHQFGFRKKHATIEQVHRIATRIRRDLDEKTYCSAAFIDMEHAFDKVWHKGLLVKLKYLIPHNMYVILKSYLTDRLFLVKYNSSTSRLYPINSGVPQGSVLGPILYSLFTSDLPTSPDTEIATFADDTAILASDEHPSLASSKLQDHLHLVEQWIKKWRMKANPNKSTQITFTTRRETCPPVTLNNTQIPQKDTVKYLGVHLDRKLLWKTHIQKKIKQLNEKHKSMWWLLGSKSQLSISNKILLYKVILKPIWTYACQLWGTASNTNIKIVERWQNKLLRRILNAGWYIRNSQINKETGTPSVRSEISNYTRRYQRRLDNHVNTLAINLLDNSEEWTRLRRISFLDLPYRFTND